MPNIPGTSGHLVARNFRAARGVEQAKLDPGRVARKQREIDAPLAASRTQGTRQSGVHELHGSGPGLTATLVKNTAPSGGRFRRSAGEPRPADAATSVCRLYPEPPKRTSSESNNLRYSPGSMTPISYPSRGTGVALKTQMMGLPTSSRTERRAYAQTLSSALCKSSQRNPSGSQSLP